MDNIRDRLEIDVEYFTDHEEYGTYYVASCDDIGLATDGRTFNGLLRNLKEALSLVLDYEDVRKDFNLVADPTIKLKIALPSDFLGLR